MLHWSDIDDIVEALEEAYPEEDIPENSLNALKDMILHLDEFGDQDEIDEHILQQIMESWIELRMNN